MEYEIKITGSGSRKKIIKALEGVISSLNSAEGKEEMVVLDGAVWEDSTLITTINAE